MRLSCLISGIWGHFLPSGGTVYYFSLFVVILAFYDLLYCAKMELQRNKEMKTDKVLELYKGCGLNDKEILTIDTAFEMEFENKFPAGLSLKDVKKVMPKLLSMNLIHLPTLKFCGVVRLTEKGREIAVKYAGKRICDSCEYFYVHPSGCHENCYNENMSKADAKERVSGNVTTCKSFEKLRPIAK